MQQQLIATIKANLLFYRRNGILVGIGISLLFFYGLTLIPALFFTSSTQRFDLVKATFIYLNIFTIILTGLMGLITVHYHINNRCLKMVLTKPCLPETWLLGTLIAAMFFSLILYGIIFVISFLIFPLFGFSLSQGLLYLTCYHFLIGMNIFAILSFLTVIMSPILAGILALSLNQSMFYGLTTLLTAQLKVGSSYKWLLNILKYVFYGVYMVVPIYIPFIDEISNIYSTFRVSSGDMTYLFYTFIYTLIITSFFYFLTNYCLKKKRLI